MCVCALSELLNPSTRMMKEKRRGRGGGGSAGVAFLTLLLTVLGVVSVSEGRKLVAAATFGVTQGEEVFALPCPGITPNFDSVVWIRHDENTMVGAGVNYNRDKYRYHASNGDLAIRNVEYEDAGIYRCIVTYGQGDKTIDPKRETRAVELLVSQPRRGDLWHEEYKGNTIRGLVAAAVGVTLILAACAIYKYRWKDSKYMRYSEELQLVSGLDNMGMEPEQHGGRRGARDRRDSSSSGGLSPNIIEAPVQFSGGSHI